MMHSCYSSSSVGYVYHRFVILLLLNSIVVAATTTNTMIFSQKQKSAFILFPNHNSVNQKTTKNNPTPFITNKHITTSINSIRHKTQFQSRRNRKSNIGRHEQLRISCGFLLSSLSSEEEPEQTPKTTMNTHQNPDNIIETKKTEYLATCIPGLAEVLRNELEELGASDVTILSNSAVSFCDGNDKDEKYPIALKALLWVRTAHRILEKINTFYNIQTRDDLYESIKYDMESESESDSSITTIKDLLGNGEGGLLSLSVKVIINRAASSYAPFPKDISHTHYTALTIKNALVDYVRELRDDRPNVELDNPDVPLVAIFSNNNNNNMNDNNIPAAADMTLYRSIGPPGSLHKRGYRSDGPIHKAAMKESLAAGLLLSAGWMDACNEKMQRKSTSNDGDFNTKEEKEETGGLILMDPMCGSGSLILEAILIAMDYAPGLMRIKCNVEGHQIPPILRWKSNKHLLPIWKELLLDATKRMKSSLQQLVESKPPLIQFIANDIHDNALDLLDNSLEKAGLVLSTRDKKQLVSIYNENCEDLNIIEDENINIERDEIWVVTNPPWGVRLTDNDHKSWESLRTILRDNATNNCIPGSTQAWILSGNKETTKHLGLRKTKMIPLKTGQQDLRWIQYLILERKVWSNTNDDTHKQRKKKDDIERQSFGRYDDDGDDDDDDDNYDDVNDPDRAMSPRTQNDREISNGEDNCKIDVDNLGRVMSTRNRNNREEIGGGQRMEEHYDVNLPLREKEGREVRDVTRPVKRKRGESNNFSPSKKNTIKIKTKRSPSRATKKTTRKIVEPVSSTTEDDDNDSWY